jgi:hypothetical protein
MKTIKVKKEQILDIIKENREKHKKEFSDTIKAYRAQASS